MKAQSDLMGDHESAGEIAAPAAQAVSNKPDE